MMFTVVLIVGVNNGCFGPQLSDSAKHVPSMVVKDLFNEESINTLTLFEHDVQLINVWASWCGYCRAEHGFIADLSSQGVPIIGINYRDRRYAALNFFSEMGNPYQMVIFDPKGELSDLLDVSVVPVTYVVSRRGEILFKHVGQLDKNSWKARFTEYFHQ